MRGDHERGNPNGSDRRPTDIAIPAPAATISELDISASDHPPSECEVQQLRRKITLMTAELHLLNERSAQQDEITLQLQAARARLVASSARRKELVRSICQRDAQIDKLKLAAEDFELQLQESLAREEEGKRALLIERAEHAASQARRKEMARVIGRRNARLLELEGELKIALEALALLEDRVCRSDPRWWIKKATAKLRGIRPW